jgi:glycosyltransferase involved in cell wall biosynthesis
VKVAILHYWFLLAGGGERVISALLRLYPDADVFCLFADKASLPKALREDHLRRSFLEQIPFSHKLNRALLPLYPAAVGSFDFSDYDLIISSDSAPIKAIVKLADSVHISYCHTPGRYIWDLSPAFQAKMPKLLQPVYALMSAQARENDFAAAQRVDAFVANSRYTKSRIATYYRRDSTVIYPPVDTAGAFVAAHPDDYYLSIGRFTDNKRVDLLIEACNQLRRKLVLAGTGREEKYLKSIAGPTIEFLGQVPEAALGDLYANCRAFLFAADEDFGIAPVEAQAFGRPVVAYGHGGSLETVRVGDPNGKSDTGVYFTKQSVESVLTGIKTFESKEGRFSPLQIQAHARTFDVSAFTANFNNFVKQAVPWPGGKPLLGLAS